MPTPTRRARRRLLDAPHLPIAVYLAIVGGSAVGGGGNVERAVPLWLSSAWAATLIVGAVLIVLGVAAERSRAESAGHAFHLFGMAMLAAVSIADLGAADVIAVATLASVSLLRMRVLRRARAAQQEAGRILKGGES